jgi:hypothetical protein
MNYELFLSTLLRGWYLMLICTIQIKELLLSEGVRGSRLEVRISNGLIIGLRKLVNVIVSLDLSCLVERVDCLSLRLHLGIEVLKLLIIVQKRLLLRLNLYWNLLLLLLGSLTLL